MARPPLTTHQIASRRVAARKIAIRRLEARLDAHVEAAERCKPGSKMRAKWYAGADKAREQLRIIDH